MKLTILLLIQFMLNVNSFYIKINNKKIIVQKNLKQIDDDLFYFKCENKNNDECVKIINPKNKQNDTENKEQNDTENNIKNVFYRFGTFPRLDEPNENGQLTWYPIGFKNDFGIKPKKITIKDINYIVWKDNRNYYGLRDCCSHQGSSFMLGEVCKNTISCPYHGYIFDGSSGDLLQIPKLQYVDSSTHNVDCFKVVEKADMVYLNTIPIKNEEMKNKIDEAHIFTEPEYNDKDQRCVFLTEDFEHYAKFVSVNSLDICHIGFVHTFGNRKNPNPLHNSKVIKMLDNNFHYKIIYNYIAGEKSLVNKIYNFTDIIVENEYILPHSTVARVKFGQFTSTIITHALPISKFKTKLFVKAYRSYWSYDLNNDKNKNILFPLYYLINYFGDLVTENTMYNTLKQDKSIVDYIDKTNYEDMHGKFSIIFDMFSNHYKLNYKRFYEESYRNI
jgi:phenylpropionate dioxygenase-like ring-hydroxylating dioxygenase large terminal subunit